MNALCRAVCTLLTAAVLSPSPAYATSFSIDQSDLWWILQESGWGIQLVQRGSVIFATIFVYGPANAPTWYTATMTSNDGTTWTGDLYATTGPWFGTVPFDPNTVTRRKVGTMTWSPQTATTGTLNYVVDGVAVTKNVVRQTLVLDDYSGTYSGAFHASATGCTNPADNAPPINIPSATISVTQNGQASVITISEFGVTNTISGTLTQSGQFGTLTGTYTATGGEVGNATVSAINVQTNSIAGNFSLISTNDGCQNVGYLAGMRNR